MVLAVFGCTPRYKGDVDRVLAAHAAGRRQVAAPVDLEPQSWKVGQWALYKTSQNGNVGYEKRSIVAETACGIWFEVLEESYKHRSVSKVCFRTMPDVTGDPGADARQVELVQIIVLQRDDRPAIVMDFRDGKNARMWALVFEVAGAVAPALSSLQWRGKTNLPREDLDVPAGHFAQTARLSATVTAGAKAIEVTGWVHPDVPLHGTVKFHTSDGTDVALLGYGQEGATSALPNEPLKP